MKTFFLNDRQYDCDDIAVSFDTVKIVCNYFIEPSIINDRKIVGLDEQRFEVRPEPCDVGI